MRGFFLRLSFYVMAVSVALGARLVYAQSQTSPNFQNLNPSIETIVGTAESSNYSVDATLGPFTGRVESVSFSLESGPQGNPGSIEETPPPPDPGGGGGGGGGGVGYYPPTTTSTGGFILPPSVAAQFCPYGSLAKLFGERGEQGAEVIVNGYTEGVRYHSEMTWEYEIPLGIGNNDLYIQVRVDTAYSPHLYVSIRRRLIGDVNDTQHVDDVDLSLFTRHWNDYDERSDFNCYGLIDDLDLSLLASHWNASF